MKKSIFMSLCVLLLVGTTVFGTTWSYTISGKVKAGGVGVNAAAVAHYVTWSNNTTTGGGVGPTAADGSFSASMSQSTESYVTRPMQLLASKGQMSGSKSWTCAASSEIKNVDIYLNVNVDPGLRYGGEPIHFSGATMTAPSTQVAYIEPGYTGETQLQGFTTTLAYNPTELYTEVPAVAPMQPYSFFDVLIPTPGTIQIIAEVDSMAPPVILGDVDNPTPLYVITWAATDTGIQHITTVQTEIVQMNLGPTPPGIPVEAVPHTTEHLVGDAEKCQPTFLLDSAEEWQEDLDSEWPQKSLRPMFESEWNNYIEQWNDPENETEGDLYPDTNFMPAELLVYDGNEKSDDPLDPCDGGLVMAWGDGNPDTGEYASAWKWDFGIDPDLRNSTITITVTAPQFGVSAPGVQINAVSFAINDIAGLRRSWWWRVGNPADPIQWNTPTTVTINTAMTGRGATTPQASGYMNAAGFNLAQSQSFDVDENSAWIFNSVPVPPPGNPTFVGMWNYWHNLLVTRNVGGGGVNSKWYIKYSQPPVVIDANDPPIITGWDELSDQNSPPIWADDWPCKDERFITDIHWWGSFIGWTQPYPPPIVPKAFHLGIWTNVPPGAYSHPGMLIWENYCDNWVWNFAGYDRDPFGRPEREKETCFQFTQLLSEDEWFRQEPNDIDQTIYWLSIAAIYNASDYADPDFYPWGWKTRPHKFEDDACSIILLADGSWPPKIGAIWDDGIPLTGPNLDGIVNFLDFAVIARNWLATP